MNSIWMDRFGAVASSVCAVHCAFCAFLPVAISALGFDFLFAQQTEWLFSITAILFGVVALFLGWRQHRSKRVAILMITGIVGIMVSRGIEMGSGHHEHGTDAHHDVIAHTASVNTGNALAVNSDHGSHSMGHLDSEHGEEVHADSVHLAGGVVGVFAGLFLLMGHLVNMRSVRQCGDECCP